MHLNRWIICCVVLGAAGCRRTTEEDDVAGPVPPPAAEMAAATEKLTLDQKLALMQGEIEAALKENLKGTALTRIFRAEAISDRLLEAPPPFTWLRDAYATETRLRQVQALADRCVAELRRQAPDSIIRLDITELQREIAHLRSELAAGGGMRPASLDSLLAGVSADSTAADAGPAD